ncbi:hypothetical protein [Kutzneria buriramensis]|nr:hypothetical protein [Kutzneria buriramensis]
MTTTKLTMALSAAAAIGLLAAGSGIALAADPGTGTTIAATGDAKTAQECVQADGHVPDPTTWRPAARITVDARHGFLVIRNDKLAAICTVEDGHGTGIMGGVETRHVYGKLTAARPFDYLSSMNYLADKTHPAESIHFGITTADVKSVSLVGPDKSVRDADVKDGTFVVRTPFGEDSDQATTNHVRVTLTNGQVITGPFRG